jgi:hypothetical protein
MFHSTYFAGLSLCSHCVINHSVVFGVVLHFKIKTVHHKEPLSISEDRVDHVVCGEDL